MRVFRLVATPVLLLGLLAFLVWGASWGWRNLTAPIPEPEPTPCVTMTAAAVTPATVSVRVLNGGFTSGLAYREAQRLEGVGFTVIRTGNTDERITTTLIRGGEENMPGMQLVASYFAGATIEPDGRVDGTIDVMVGSEFEGPGPEPLTEIAAGEDGTYCAPPSPSPSVSGSEAPASPEGTPPVEETPAEEG